MKTLVFLVPEKLQGFYGAPIFHSDTLVISVVLTQCE